VNVCMWNSLHKLLLVILVQDYPQGAVHQLQGPGHTVPDIIGRGTQHGGFVGDCN
jgi:hypothetical protein